MYTILIRAFRSLLFRSGLIIEIDKHIAITNFNNALNRQNARLIVKVVQLFTRNYNSIELNFLGKLNQDGTYPVIKNRVYKNKDALSFGVGNNITMDTHCAELGMKVSMFDHTRNPEIPLQLSQSVRHYPFGITGSNQMKDCHRLSFLLEKCKVDIDQVELLKMDIEGCEWDVLENDFFLIRKIPQIIVEFHNLDKFTNEELADRMYVVLQKVLDEYHCVYISPNNFSGHSKVDGFVWPFTLEVLFVRKDLLDLRLNPKFDIDLFEKQQVKNWKFGKPISLRSWFSIK